MSTTATSAPVDQADTTRPSTASSFCSGVTSPSGSSEDEFFDASETLGPQGQASEQAELRVPTPQVSADLPPTLHPDTAPAIYPSLPRFTPAPVPPKYDDFSSLDSQEEFSEDETVTSSFPRRLTSSPNLETGLILTEEIVIPGINGGTTNILTFLSPNPDSRNREFTFAPINESMSFEFFSRDPNLTPPLPDSEPLDETLQERPLTPEFPPPPSPILNKITMVSNSQRLYPQLDSLSPPPPPEEQKETLSLLPLSHFTPPPPPPADYFQTTPIPMPQMEHNPLYNPDAAHPSLQTELLLASPIPPMMMNSLTQQIILAQQQALNQHFPASIPLTQQIHPNVLSGFQNFPSPHHFNLSPSFGHINDAQYYTSEQLNAGDDEEGLAEWKRDLISKEKRILKEKYGDNRMNVFTTGHQSKQSSQFQSDVDEVENLSPAPPFPQSPLEFHSAEMTEYSTEDRVQGEETPRDRIVYPSLNSNSSDEDSLPLNNQPIKNEIIVPGFISRMRNANNATQTDSRWIIPPSEAGYTSPIPLPFVHPENPPMDTHNTSLLHQCPTVLTPPPYKPKNRNQTELIENRTILFPPELSQKSPELPSRPIFKPPSREIKRPPTHNKATKREITYPPGLEPNTSPKKKVIYPPNATKKIIYPPKNEITRPPVFLNKTCILDANNDISYSGEREIFYPHSWSDSPALSPTTLSPKQIHYPPKQPILLETEQDSIEDIPVIPREASTQHGDVTPPIIDSSGEEDDTLVTSRPLESTPKKPPLPPQTEDKPDSESENAGFETPTELD